jgi:hypothetical protein
MSSADAVKPRFGAYGLHLAGLGGLGDLLVTARHDWPTTEIVVEQGRIDRITEHLDENDATIVFGDAAVRVERDPARATFRFVSRTSVAAIVHPYLAPVAGLFAHWRGREALHAGGFVHQGAAWGIVADRGGGKSSTLAHLALNGLGVVADDLLVVDDVDVLAGPRSIDLREEPAHRLRVGVPLGRLGSRERWRARLPGVASASPLGGWIFLEWGTTVSVEPVSPRERLERLGAQRMIRRAPIDPSALLRLSTLPAILLRRPRSWDALPETTEALLGSLPLRAGDRARTTGEG